MTTLYLDTFSGISGDMFLGALLDLGVDAAALRRELEKLGLPGWQPRIARGQKASITGTKFDVHLEDEHGGGGGHDSHPDGAPPRAGESARGGDHGPHGGPLVRMARGDVELSVFETNVPPRFRLYFRDARGRPAAPAPAGAVTLETIRPGRKRQVFEFKRRAGYLEATAELPEPHEFTAVLRVKRGGAREEHRVRFVEDHHHDHHHHHGPHDDSHHPHSHPHSQDSHESHGHSHDHAHAHGRTFTDIQDLIRRSDLTDWVKQKAVAVFRRIAVAEGRIHGLSPEEVHFHEVGAVDSIVDIVGACAALELLGKPRVLSAPVVEGTGFIHCAHGRFPLPAPATLAILGARGIAVTQCEEPHELVTPTGAALLAEFAEAFAPMQGLVATRIGYGLGTRDNHTRPNVLRAVLGESTAGTAPTAHDWESDTVAAVETNLDDISPEILGDFVERAFAAGALDVFHTPVQMKKGRPGVLLTVLCATPDADKFCELILRETTAFGVRHHTAARRKLQREFTTAQTAHGEVRIKLGRLDGKIVQAAPEFESCRKLAADAGVPLKEIYEAALRAVTRSQGP